MQIIDGKALAEKINDQTVQEIIKLDHRPNLAIILVGENPDSALYVNKKIETGKKVGIDTHLYRCPADIGQEMILETIDFLNKDESIDGIMVQLPLPKDQDYDTDQVIRKINPDKDVDRFHPDNIKPLTDSCDSGLLVPPVYGVILEMLKSINCDLAGKNVAILAKSGIFGESLKKILECRGADASICNPDDDDLAEKTSAADILITVIGRPKFVKKDMVKKDAVVIDVGITREMGSIYGDVDFEDVSGKPAWITPVPGGVGPMTVAITLRNTLGLYKKKSNE
jgi:methylenetetrahydrofolate dehydrogenase (NADP+)/methenyltetrahydrofolate cyclohydrolase